MIFDLRELNVDLDSAKRIAKEVLMLEYPNVDVVDISVEDRLYVTNTGELENLIYITVTSKSDNDFIYPSQQSVTVTIKGSEVNK